jgi:SNF2 family DNA or RNA helicase
MSAAASKTQSAPFVSPEFHDWDLCEYQDHGSEFIIDNPFCALWFDMGLGKTIATLTALDQLLEAGVTNGILVVAPLRVARKTWPDEIHRWAHVNHLTFAKIIGDTPAKRMVGLKQKADIHLVNRENLDWLVDQFLERQPELRKGRRVYKVVGKWPWDTMILDESTSFKNKSSSRWSAANRVRRYLKRMIQLTGRPAPKGYLDLWAQIYLLDRGERLGRSMKAYKKRWFEPPDYGQFRWNLKEAPDNPWAAIEIQGLIKDLCLTMRAKDWLEVPDVKLNPIRVTLTPAQRKIYKKMQKHYVAEIAGKKIVAVNTGVLANKLLQLCNGAVYDKERAVAVLHDAKVKAACDFVDEAHGKPVMIAYAYQHDIHRLTKALKRGNKGRDIRMLKTEQDEDDWNAGLIDVLIIHPLSGGHGLNLQYGGEIILWFGLTWSLELWDQLNARLMGGHRGVGRKIVLNAIILEGSYDERVLRCLAADDATQDDLLESMKTWIKEVL